MSKLLILNAPNSYNYGSAMMAINVMYYLNKINNNAKYVLLVNTEDDYIRYIKETNNQLKIIKLLKNKLPFRANNKLLKFFEFRKKTITEENNLLDYKPSGAIVLGGDSFYEGYGIINLLLKFYKYNRLVNQIPLFFIGQTIGPFKSWRRYVASSIMKKWHIYTRDSWTKDYLRDSLNLKENIYQSADLAFLDLPQQNNKELKENILNKYKLYPNKYLTIIPSGITQYYTSNKNEYLKSWFHIIRKLIESDELKNCKIVLLAHVVGPKNVDDRVIINELMESMSLKEKQRIVAITDVLLPSQARLILGHGLFTITGRMHGAISTFQMGKPAISLSYSPKYQGVIGDGLGMTDLIIEANDNNLWESENIVKLVMKKVSFMTSNYTQLIADIKLVVGQAKVLAMKQIKDIANKLKAGNI